MIFHFIIEIILNRQWKHQEVYLDGIFEFYVDQKILLMQIWKKLLNWCLRPFWRTFKHKSFCFKFEIITQELGHWTFGFNIQCQWHFHFIKVKGNKRYMIGKFSSSYFKNMEINYLILNGSEHLFLILIYLFFIKQASVK